MFLLYVPNTEVYQQFVCALLHLKGKSISLYVYYPDSLLNSDIELKLLYDNPETLKARF